MAIICLGVSATSLECELFEDKNLALIVTHSPLSSQHSAEHRVAPQYSFLWVLDALVNKLILRALALC